MCGFQISRSINKAADDRHLLGRIIFPVWEAWRTTAEAGSGIAIGYVLCLSSTVPSAEASGLRQEQLSRLDQGASSGTLSHTSLHYVHMNGGMDNDAVEQSRSGTSISLHSMPDPETNLTRTTRHIAFIARLHKHLYAPKSALESTASATLSTVGS